MFSLHVRRDDRTLEYLRYFIAFSNTTRDTLRAKCVDQQWTSSSSATYSITIAIKHRSYHNSQTEISRKKITFWEPVIPLLHPLIVVFQICRAVQPTQLRSPSNTDHTTIARQRYLEKKLHFGNL